MKQSNFLWIASSLSFLAMTLLWLMIEQVANWVINIISTLGYPGIMITMAIESALIPLPSEIIMPFSGFLVSTGRFNLNMVALMGAIGNVLGSLIAYGIGYWGHERLVRRFVRKFGGFILLLSIAKLI